MINESATRRLRRSDVTIATNLALLEQLDTSGWSCLPGIANSVAYSLASMTSIRAPRTPACLIGRHAATAEWLRRP
jgi:hypothetical protein